MSYLKQHILFDLDDTLVHCNKYFDLILNHFFDLLQEWFATHNLTKNTIREKQIEIDVAGVHQVGFASEHFPQSLIDTYQFSRNNSDAVSIHGKSRSFALLAEVYTNRKSNRIQAWSKR